MKNYKNETKRFTYKEFAKFMKELFMQIPYYQTADQNTLKAVIQEACPILFDIFDNDYNKLIDW